MKTRVAVLFGGHSVEHEVSIITGVQVFCAVDRQKYDVIPLYLTKDNRFFTGKNLEHIEAYRDMDTCLKQAVQVIPVRGVHGVDLFRYPPKPFSANIVGGFDVVIPAVHGTNVEDGTLMGMLEMLNVPYAACDVTSSALGMDKWAMKAVLREAGIPVLDALCFSAHDYVRDSDGVAAAVEARLTYPVIVKPVDLGSSIGISKANDRDELLSAFDLAVEFAPRVLVEHAVTDLREINCAVLGDADDARASACEEPLNATDILSFGDKYLGGSKGGSKGMADLKRRCPAQLPDGMTEQVQQLAVQTFKALGCLGVARVDFLNDRSTGELWVNEINTIPGSLAFYLWKEVGLDFPALMDELIRLAFKRHRERAALTFTYESSILSGFCGSKGSKGAKF